MFNVRVVYKSDHAHLLSAHGRIQWGKRTARKHMMEACELWHFQECLFMLVEA